MGVVDGRKCFALGKRTKPLLGVVVVVVDMESGGGSLRRLHSRRAWGGRQRLGTAGRRRRTAEINVGGWSRRCRRRCRRRPAEIIVVSRCSRVFPPPLFLPPSPSSFVIHLLADIGKYWIRPATTPCRPGDVVSGALVDTTLAIENATNCQASPSRPGPNPAVAI